MLIDNMQAKDFVKFDIMKIMIHLAWVPNSMVIFSVSYHSSHDLHLSVSKMDASKVPDLP